MPRRRTDGSTASNKTIYHYQVVELDENNEKFNVKYFLTCKEVENTYGISQKSVWKLTANPEYESRKAPHIKVFKVYKPVYETREVNYPAEDII